MCVVCIEMAKGRLKPMEAKAALAEIALDPEQKKHVSEVLKKLEEEEKRKTSSQRAQIQPMNDTRS